MYNFNRRKEKHSQFNINLNQFGYAMHIPFQEHSNKIVKVQRTRDFNFNFNLTQRFCSCVFFLLFFLLLFLPYIISSRECFSSLFSIIAFLPFGLWITFSSLDAKIEICRRKQMLHIHIYIEKKKIVEAFGQPQYLLLMHCLCLCRLESIILLTAIMGLIQARSPQNPLFVNLRICFLFSVFVKKKLIES